MKLLFPEITFIEDTHQYYNNEDGSMYTSVTTSIKRMTKPFQKSFWLRKKSQELGISTSVLEAQWAQKMHVGSCVGNICHLYAENLFRNKIIQPFVKIPEACVEEVNIKFEKLKPMVEAFVEDHKYLNIFGQELILKINNLCGMADMITQNDDSSLSIYDFKTNNKLNTYSDKFLGELNHLKAHDVIKFSLQLSVYELALRSLGYEVKERIIVWFCTENETYELINLEYFEKEAIFLSNYDYN
jgi:hypothetical protein